MSFVRTFKKKCDGGGQDIHLTGLSDYTLCGLDTSGDDMVHEKEPQFLTGRHRINCVHCISIIEIVKDHLNNQ